MDDDMLKEIADRIAEEMQQTQEAIQSYEAHSQPVSPDDSIGRVSRMDAINNQSVIEASLRQARERLAALKRQQARLGSEDFGLCARCRRAIPPMRLVKMPQSPYCVHCAARG